MGKAKGLALLLQPCEMFKEGKGPTEAPTLGAGRRRGRDKVKLRNELGRCDQKSTMMMKDFLDNLLVILLHKGCSSMVRHGVGRARKKVLWTNRLKLVHANHRVDVAIV